MFIVITDYLVSFVFNLFRSIAYCAVIMRSKESRGIADEFGVDDVLNILDA